MTNPEAYPDKWKALFIEPFDSLLIALKKMDEIQRKLLVLVEEGGFRGLLSIGDIQRAIIQNLPLNSAVTSAMREHQRYAKPETQLEEIEAMMLEHRMELCPVVDRYGRILDIHFWEDRFPSREMRPKKTFDLPVVIMAGGLGTRLRPLTQVLPKPLIPIGERTILEEIIERFYRHGCRHYHLSLNYKSDLIQYYLDKLELPVELHYHVEKEALGTGGSLSLMRGSIQSTFFVSNCDILITNDYSEILDYHITEGNEFTIVSALKSFPIAYGTLETDKGGRLASLQEKPELTFKINTGMYILEPHLLDMIPDGTEYPITKLIEKLIVQGSKVGVYPVSEHSWKDIGDANLLKDYLSFMGYGEKRN